MPEVIDGGAHWIVEPNPGLPTASGGFKGINENLDWLENNGGWVEWGYDASAGVAKLKRIAFPKGSDDDEGKWSRENVEDTDMAKGTCALCSDGIKVDLDDAPEVHAPQHRPHAPARAQQAAQPQGIPVAIKIGAAALAGFMARDIFMSRKRETEDE